MAIIPQDLQREILSRLPIKSLLRFKSACRSWCALLEEPSFTNLHLSRSKHNSHIATLTFLHKNHPSLLFLSIEKTNPNRYNNAASVCFIPHRTQFRLNRPTFMGSYISISSCNGLLCFPGFLQPPAVGCNWDTLCVGNPITGEYLSLPPLPFEPGTFYYHGIGFDSTAGEYKVVVIYSSKRSVQAEAVICTLRGSLSWRFLGEIPCRIYTESCDHTGFFVDGALYWWKEIFHSAIVAMDMRREKFHLIELSIRNRFISSLSEMVEWDGCLGVFTYSLEGSGNTWRYDIMALKDYPPKEEEEEEGTIKTMIESWSWTEVVGWDLRSFPFYLYDDGPIFVLRNGDIFVVRSPITWALHNLKTRRTARFKKSILCPDKFDSRWQMLIYEPSLVRIGIKNE